MTKGSLAVKPPIAALPLQRNQQKSGMAVPGVSTASERGGNLAFSAVGRASIAALIFGHAAGPQEDQAAVLAAGASQTVRTRGRD